MSQYEIHTRKKTRSFWNPVRGKLNRRPIVRYVLEEQCLFPCRNPNMIPGHSITFRTGRHAGCDGSATGTRLGNRHSPSGNPDKVYGARVESYIKVEFVAEFSRGQEMNGRTRPDRMDEDFRNDNRNNTARDNSRKGVLPGRKGCRRVPDSSDLPANQRRTSPENWARFTSAQSGKQQRHNSWFGAVTCPTGMDVTRRRQTGM